MNNRHGIALEIGNSERITNDDYVTDYRARKPLQR